MEYREMLAEYRLAMISKNEQIPEIIICGHVHTVAHSQSMHSLYLPRYDLTVYLCYHCADYLKGVYYSGNNETMEKSLSNLKSDLFTEHLAIWFGTMAQLQIALSYTGKSSLNQKEQKNAHN